jgi:hypothetical protein
MHLSYDSKLATRDGMKCRQIITSPSYQRLWGHRVRLRPDQNQKTRFDNLAGGHRLSTSEGGVITGEGGDIIIFDDPHNVRAIGGASDVAREKTLRFWDESMPSRLNDQDNGVFIVIMQRVHERDLSGHILTNELDWTHLCLPARYEPKHPHPIRTSVVRKSTGKVWKDPRNEVRPHVRIHCKCPAERTGNRPQFERYCGSIPGARSALRSCPAGSSAEVGLRWCGGTAVAYRMEDPSVEVCQEANSSSNLSHCRHEDGAAEPKRAQAQTGGVVLQAIACHRNASIAGGRHDRRDNEGHGLAAALGAGLSGRSGTQAS